jgi:hypothetical protein
MTANPYAYDGPGTRWAEEDPTSADALNIARINADHNKTALGRVMDTTVLEGPYTQAYHTAVEAAEDAHRLIIVDLDDPDTIWDLDAFYQQAQNTSWWAELGAPPVHGAMWINAAQTSLKWWNRETGVEYMSFTVGASNMGTGQPSSLRFLDGLLYYTGDGAGGYGILWVDFIRDLGSQTGTGNQNIYNGNISERNDGNGWTARQSSVVLAEGTTTDVDAIRDRFGRVDEFGRPVHWWAVACDDGAAGRVSVYNARDDAIYDSSSTSMFGSVAISPTTGAVFAGERSITESVENFGPIWSIDADTFVSQDNLHLSTSPEILDGDPDTIAILPGRSAARQGGDVVLVGTTNVDPGVSMWHVDPIKGALGGVVHITADYNSPYMVGNCGLALPFEGDASDVSHNANTPTASGAGVTYAAGVIGLGATFDGVDSLSNTSLSACGIAAGGEWTFACWAKSSSASNPGAANMLCALEKAGPSNRLQIFFDTDGSITARVQDDGATGYDSVNPSADFYDALWHHIVFTARGGNLYVYVDGVEVGTTTQTANSTGAFTVDEIRLGRSTSGSLLSGSLDDVSFTPSAAWTVEEVRWNYQRGLRAMSSTAGNADQAHSGSDIENVQADQRSGLWVSSHGSAVDIWDEFGILVAVDTPTAGSGIADAAVKLMPGGVVHYVMGDSGNIEFVQPDTRVADLVAEQVALWRVPDRGAYAAIVELDGSGDFHRIQDAVDYCSAGDSIYIGPGQHDNPVNVNKANMLVEGSGRGTLVTPILAGSGKVFNITGADVTIRNLAAQTTAGAGLYTYPFDLGVGCDGSRLENCWVLESDSAGIVIRARATILGCYIEDTDEKGINVVSGGSNSVIVGNIIDDTGGDTIDLDSGGDNCVVQANRTDGAIVDGSTGSTVGNNDETAF